MQSNGSRNATCGEVSTPCVDLRIAVRKATHTVNIVGTISVSTPVFVARNLLVRGHDNATITSLTSNNADIL